MCAFLYPRCRRRRRVYHADEPGYQRAGRNAAQLWRFIREMSEGDLVVVPHGGQSTSSSPP